MNRLKLFSGPLSMFGMKAHIAALEKGVDVEVELVPFNEKSGYDPKHPEVIRVNPKRQVPILIHGDLEIFDSTQIFEFLEDLFPDPPLWPTSPAHRARARLLEHASDEVFFPHVIRLMGLQDALDGREATAEMTAANDYYFEMERQLEMHPFIAGPFSYADIAFFMAALFAERMGAPMTDDTPKLLTWRRDMTKRSSVQQALTPMIEYLVAADRPVPDFL